MLPQYPVPTIIQSDSQTVTQTDITAAVTGGVVTVVVVMIIAVTVIAIVALLLKNRRGHFSPRIKRLYVIIKSWRSLYICFFCTEVKWVQSTLQLNLMRPMDWLRSQGNQHTTCNSDVWKHGQPLCVLSYLFIVYSDPDSDRPITEAATPHSSQPPAGDSLYEPV